jgi:DNA-binding IclR family transcriptional regulator
MISCIRVQSSTYRGEFINAYEVVDPDGRELPPSALHAYLAGAPEHRDYILSEEEKLRADLLCSLAYANARPRSVSAIMPITGTAARRKSAPGALAPSKASNGPVASPEIREKVMRTAKVFLEDGLMIGSAAARAVAILETVSRSNKPVSAVELGSRLSLPKATVHRQMLLLEEINFLQREPGTKRFIAGERLVQMSLETLINAPKRAERHAVLEALVEEVQETCNVTMLVGNEIVYIDRVECHWPLRTHFQIGSRVPIHCGASGKLFLSLMPAAKRRRLLRPAALKRYTEKTVLDPDIIEGELKRIRSTKVGIDVEEFVHGLIGLAVPVFDRRGRMCATVSMHAPTLRVTVERALDFVPALRRAAAAVSATL